MLKKKSSAKSAGRTRAVSEGRGIRTLVSVALLGLLLQGCMVLRVRQPRVLDDAKATARIARGEFVVRPLLGVESRLKALPQ